jgi:hypothetical protein
MNLAEFPLSSLSDRAPKGQKTLVFEDTIWDTGKDCEITRRLTISGSDKYGLPTALDDEVSLGLLQLTKAKGFVSRQVPFSRYRLIEILGWRDEGKSYRRIETSLKRWLGVTLYYENAWWDKTHRTWVDEHFHLLDNVTLSSPFRRGAKATAEDEMISSFTWNKVIYRSFQSGYLKQLDMEIYRKLCSSVSKRMFRFLDKRFYRAPELTFDIFRFSFEHIGFSRSYDASQLKRRLFGPILELEEVGFLSRMAKASRFRRLGRGLWQVRFKRNGVPCGGDHKRAGEKLRDDSRKRQPSARTHGDDKRVLQYLGKLTERQRNELEAQALEVAPKLMADGYRRAKEAGNDELLSHYRDEIIRGHVRKALLSKRGS